MEKQTAISVIIVNYNVEYFLAQCLTSVFTAIKALQTKYPLYDCEVFVVDNQSADGSVKMVKKDFPQVHLIINQDNAGFAKANNQAYEKANGKYVLALNPDTLIEENTLLLAHDYMEQHTEIGALGPKLINGNGVFLKESKRALPTPWVAFYKIFGLSALFPQSHKAGKYHLSYLPENEISEVEVLAGAFMFVRKSVLDKIGFFDERFFMYGEDIDLSYRILSAGHKVVYYPEITVIHYKGESTKKASFNYVYVFYKAMKLFAEKHFSKKHAFWYNMLINLAIYFRAFLSLINRIIKALALPLYDFAVVYGVFAASVLFWEWYKWNASAYYPPEFKLHILSLYALFFVFGLWFRDNYKPVFHVKNIWAGLFSGGILLLSAYALFSESLRYSRAILLIGTMLSFFVVPAARWLITLLPGLPYKYFAHIQVKAIMAGEEKSIQKAQKILELKLPNVEVLGYISEASFSEKVLGNLQNIKEITRIYQPHELIFCLGDYSARDIIQTIFSLNNQAIDFKIFTDGFSAVIGSNSVYTDAEFVRLKNNSFIKFSYRFQKRFFDIIFALALLLFYPILAVFFERGIFLRNILSVLSGKRTWFSAIETEEKNAILVRQHQHQEKNMNLNDQNDWILHENDSFINDFWTIIKNFKKLGTKK